MLLCISWSLHMCLPVWLDGLTDEDRDRLKPGKQRRSNHTSGLKLHLQKAPLCQPSPVQSLNNALPSQNSLSFPCLSASNVNAIQSLGALGLVDTENTLSLHLLSSASCCCDTQAIALQWATLLWMIVNASCCLTNSTKLFDNGPKCIIDLQFITPVFRTNFCHSQANTPLLQEQWTCVYAWISPQGSAIRCCWFPPALFNFRLQLEVHIKS